MCPIFDIKYLFVITNYLFGTNSSKAIHAAIPYSTFGHGLLFPWLLFNLSCWSRIKTVWYHELYGTNFGTEILFQKITCIYTRELLLAHHMPQLSQYIWVLYIATIFKTCFCRTGLVVLPRKMNIQNMLWINFMLFEQNFSALILLKMH